MVKPNWRGIIGTTVSLKMIECALYTFAVCKSIPVSLLSPRSVAAQFAIRGLNRFDKKKKTVQFVQRLISSNQLNLNAGSLTKCNSSKKKDDMADSV